MSSQQLQPLLKKLSANPAITYMAVNAAGDVVSNQANDSVNAVTWGVFPGKLRAYVANLPLTKDTW